MLTKKIGGAQGGTSKTALSIILINLCRILAAPQAILLIFLMSYSSHAISDTRSALAVSAIANTLLIGGDESIMLCPPPQYRDGPGMRTVFAGEDTYSFPREDRPTSKLTFKARLISKKLNQVNIDINGSYFEKVGKDYQEYSVIIDAGNSGPRITAYRGGFDVVNPNGFVDVSNPNVRHCVEIRDLHISEVQGGE